MKHVGILAHIVEGAALCLRAFFHEGEQLLGTKMHPDVTLECIPAGRMLAEWEAADYGPIRTQLATSVTWLALAGADFFLCPDNTSHIALEEPGADFAAKNGDKRVGIQCMSHGMSHD